jgi:hypothetical protein
MIVIVLYSTACGLDAEGRGAVSEIGSDASETVRTASLWAVCDWIGEKYRDWADGDSEEEEDDSADDDDEPTHEGEGTGDHCRLTSDLECEVYGAMLAEGISHEMGPSEIMQMDASFAMLIVGAGEGKKSAGMAEGGRALSEHRRRGRIESARD